MIQELRKEFAFTEDEEHDGEVSDKEAVESLYYGMWFETTRELDKIKEKQRELQMGYKKWLDGETK